MVERYESALWERRIVANTSAFQAEDAGSIPVVPSGSVDWHCVNIAGPFFYVLQS